MPLDRVKSSPNSSSNINSAARSPRLTAATAIVIAMSDFPVPAGPMISVLDPLSIPPPKSWSNLAISLVSNRSLYLFAIFSSYQTRKNLHAAGPYYKIMITTAVRVAPDTS